MRGGENVTDQRAPARALAGMVGMAALTLTVLAGIVFGSVHISLAEIWQVLTGSLNSEAAQIIYNIRLPRVLSGACVGINLAVAGCIMQGIFSNPMADSSTTGVSAGAGFVAIAIMMLFPTSTHLIPICAFAGAMLTIAIVFGLAWRDGLSPFRLILSGIIVSSFFGALTTILFVLFSDRVQSVVSWMAGSLQAQTWRHVSMILPYTCLGLVASLWGHRQLNLLQLGEEASRGLGVRLNHVRLGLIMLAAVLAASSVSVAGMVGFVGLIIPHTARMIVGSDFEYLLPCSALFGSALVVGADTLSRYAFRPMEIPVGIFMALLGAPFFIYLLQKKGNR